MTNVLCHRRWPQPLFLIAIGLMLLALFGCTRSAEQIPATTTPPAASPEQPDEDASAGGDARPESEPGQGGPADDAAPEEGPAGEAPAGDQLTEDGPPADDAEEKTPGGQQPAVGDGSTQPPSDPVQVDPNELSAVHWLPEPVPNPEAMAETEVEMKSYTEKIPETDVSFEMVPIAGGKFIMGSPESEEGRAADEGPQHEVVIEPFWMGKCEVTWDEYELYGLSLDYQRRKLRRSQSSGEPSAREKLIDAIARPTNPYTDMTFGMGKSGYPAICMSQLAAKGYCKWLSAKTGRYYRLPTEAEWEYACRAGTTTAYSFGDDPAELDDYGWYFDNSEDGYHKVGEKKPNPWGLYDMHGNVQELVLDQYIPDFYTQFAGKTMTRPLAVPTTRYPRVARGGCWDDDPERLRSAARRGSTQDWKLQDPQIPQSIWYFTEVFCPGFRVVRPLQTPGPEEAKLYEWDIKEIREYQEAQGGKM